MKVSILEKGKEAEYRYPGIILKNYLKERAFPFSAIVDSVYMGFQYMNMAQRSLYTLAQKWSYSHWRLRQNCHLLGHAGKELFLLWGNEWVGGLAPKGDKGFEDHLEDLWDTRLILIMMCIAENSSWWDA